jgi:chemotaxis protein methyltransferase CheR
MTDLNEVRRQAHALIASRLGLDLSAERLTALDQEILSICRAGSRWSPDMYLAWLAALSDESPEWRRLVQQLTVCETYFLRDRASFAVLEEHVLLPLIAARRAAGHLHLRLWSAACATGEEAYSLAILLDRLIPDRSAWNLTLLATDINLQALDVAQQGRYREWSFRETPTWVQAYYFRQHDAKTFEVDPKIRQMVTFMPHNLVAARTPAMLAQSGMMDVIFCRNVLMYFIPAARRATVAHLQQALSPGGWLAVSATETSDALLQPLLPVYLPGAIFYRKEATALTPALLQHADDGLLHRRSSLLRPPGEALTGGAGPQRLVKAPHPLKKGEGKEAPSHNQRDHVPGTAQPAAPLNPATTLQHVRDLADQGELQQARALCQTVLVQNRLNPEAHILLAMISQECGELVEALEALQRAIYLAPHAASAHLLLGSLLLQHRKYRRGRRALGVAIQLLEAIPRHEIVLYSGGLTAGRLLEMARAYGEFS